MRGEEELSLGQARRLIEAIRKIKHQKQRPSLERITHALGHRPDLVERHLELAVSKGFILKVAELNADVTPVALGNHELFLALLQTSLALFLLPRGNK